MCGRFSLTSSPETLTREFGIPPAQASRLVARFNIAPGQPIAMVAAGPSAGSRLLDHAVWGLIPSWSKDPTMGARLINARSETVLEKPSFKASMLHHRCLIPADGYYEWKKAGLHKQPYYFREKSGRPFTMAGIWSDWGDGDGGQIRTCAILTREALGPVRAIHERMPVIIPPEARAAWLDPRLSAPAQAAGLLAAPQELPWEIQPVSTRVNDPRNDDPSCVERTAELPKSA